MGSGKRADASRCTRQQDSLEIELSIAEIEPVLELIGSSGSPSMVRMRVLLERRLESLRAELGRLQGSRHAGRE